jgi:rare lipoprotein A
LRANTNRARRAAIGAGALLSMSTAAVAVAAESGTSPQAAPAPTATTAAAPSSPAAKPRVRSNVSVTSVRRHVLAGRATIVTGRVLPASDGRRVLLQVRTAKGWTTVDRGRTTGTGRYRLTWAPGRTGSRLLRVRYPGNRFLRPAVEGAGRANVYRRALASWYGPGLYGNPLGCGGRLHRGTIGVAHKSLPCGSRITLRHRGRTVRTRVIDRGPYVGAREFDLTQATKQRLGFGSVGTVLVTR